MSTTISNSQVQLLLFEYIIRATECFPKTAVGIRLALMLLIDKKTVTSHTYISTQIATKSKSLDRESKTSEKAFLDAVVVAKKIFFKNNHNN